MATTGNFERCELEVDKEKYKGKPCPSYRQPEEIGCLSQDEERTVFIDRREARICKSPPTASKLGWDLNEGYSRFKWVDERKSKLEGIDPILQWLVEKRAVLDRFRKPDSPSGLHTDFVMFRGMMTRLLCSPYETLRSKPWRLRVCRFNDTIFVCNDADFEESIRTEPSPREKLMCYWGYSFESFLTSHIDPEIAKKSQPNNSAGFATVIRSRLGSHSLLLVGEVDGELEGSVAKPPQNYVELKTHRQVTAPRNEESFCRFKLLRTWAQCFTVGIPTVVFGFRDNDGIVQNVETYSTAKIYQRCTHLWQPTVCMNFANEFLCWLRRVIVETDPSEMEYVVEFNAPFDCMSLQRVRLGPSRQPVLSSRFVDAMRP